MTQFCNLFMERPSYTKAANGNAYRTKILWAHRACALYVYLMR